MHLESVGDISIRYDPPRRGRVIPMMILDMKPKKILKIAVHNTRPKGDLRPVE